MLLLFQTQGRESIAAKLVANLITEAGANRVLACDLHSGQSMGYFDIPVDHVYGQVIHPCLQGNFLDICKHKTCFCFDRLVIVHLFACSPSFLIIWPARLSVQMIW